MSRDRVLRLYIEHAFNTSDVSVAPWSRGTCSRRRRRGDVYNLRFTPWRTIVAAFYTTIKVSSTAPTVRVPVMSLYNPEERKRPRTWATSARAISSFSHKRARFGGQISEITRDYEFYFELQLERRIIWREKCNRRCTLLLLHRMSLRSLQSCGSIFSSIFLSLLSLSFSLYLILSEAELSSSKVREKRRPCVRNDYYDEAFRGHERTNATPRRWGVAVVAVWLARLTITPFHPRSRAPLSPLPAGSLSPSNALSLASLGHPCMCVPASLSLSLSLHQWIHPHLFPAFFSPIVFFLSISSFASCAFLLHPLKFFVPLSLSFSLSSLLRCFFLLYRSIYPYLLLFLSFSLSHSRASPYSPCRARLLLSLSNPPDTGQAGGHVNIGSANRAPSDVIRVGSRTVRERSRGRKGAFVDPGGRCATDGVGMDASRFDL